MTTVTNKNGIEFDIDAIATDLNNKVDLDGTNATYPHVVSRTANSNGGIVETWSDGYCVQTGFATQPSSGSPFTITLSQSYKDINYIVTLGTYRTGDLSDGWAYQLGSVGIKLRGSFKFYLDSSDYVSGCHWRTEGYIR